MSIHLPLVALTTAKTKTNNKPIPHGDFSGGSSGKSVKYCPTRMCKIQLPAGTQKRQRLA